MDPYSIYENRSLVKNANSQYSYATQRGYSVRLSDDMGALLYEESKSDYTSDILDHLLKKESLKPKIHLQSPQLQFRGALVCDLRMYASRLKLTRSTLHSAVWLLDLFMDAHDLRCDRLTDISLVCLSLAAKVEEKFGRAPSIKAIRSVSDIPLTAETVRELEWTVARHARWRLLMPTPVTFALLLVHSLITPRDLVYVSKPGSVEDLQEEALALLNSYLDLTLSDVRLNVVDPSIIGCACVACARSDMGLERWPDWLATLAKHTCLEVLPIIKLLQRMMQTLKSREGVPDTPDTDQGYYSARNSPSLTGPSSPCSIASPSTSSCSSTLSARSSSSRLGEDRTIKRSSRVLDDQIVNQAKRYRMAIQSESSTRGHI